MGDRGLVIVSADGDNWAPIASSGTTQRLNNVIHAAGQYVAVGEGGTVLTSADARVWTPRESGVTGWLRGLVYHPGLNTFAASGQGGVLLYSGDGATWDRLPIAGATADLEALVAVESYAHFVATGQSGVIVTATRKPLVSAAGDLTEGWFATVSTTNLGVRLRGLVQGASALFVSGEGGTIAIAPSDTGPWFVNRSLYQSSGNLPAGTFHNDRLFLVGENETVLRSQPLFTSRFANISTRGQAGAGLDAMISGFVVTGSRPKPVLVRTVGPTLASSFGLSGSLVAPVLQITDAAGAVVAANSGWTTAHNRSAIEDTTRRLGAFPFGATSRDSAALLTLNPGSYTAQVSGSGGARGLALVEVYDSEALAANTSRTINISTRGVVGSGANALGRVFKVT